MQLNRPLKLITGILAWLPISYLIGAMAVVALLLNDERSEALRHGELLSEELGAPFIAFIVLTGLILLLNYGAMIFLMVHAGMDKQLEVGWKVAWIILLLLGNIVVYPIYWYRRVWREGAETPLSPRGRLVFAAISAFPFVWLGFIVAVGVATGLQGPEGERITILWALVFDVIFLPMWVYTVVHIVRNRGLSAAAKIVWVAVVVCSCVIAMPVYWLVGAARDCAPD